MANTLATLRIYGGYITARQSLMVIFARRKIAALTIAAESEQAADTSALTTALHLWPKDGRWKDHEACMVQVKSIVLDMVISERANNG